MLLYVWISAFIVIFAALLREARDKHWDVAVAIALLGFWHAFLAMAVSTSNVRPFTMDAAFRTIDLALGLDGLAFPPFLVTHTLYGFVGPVYAILPIVMVLPWAIERSHTLLRAAVIGAVLAFPCYLLLPAVGPQYAFSNFPLGGAAIADRIHLRNCMPSMHFTWALLAALNMRNRYLRVFCWLFAILTPLAAVACGEHYFIDMLAAIPFTWLVQKLATIRISPAHALGYALRGIPGTVGSGKR